MGIIGLIIFVGVDALEFHPMANLSAVMGAMMYGLSMVYIFKLNFKDTKLMAAASRSSGVGIGFSSGGAL